MKTLQLLLADDRKVRTEIVKQPIILTLSGPATELLPPGSGVVVVADAESTIFDELEKAVADKDTQRINEIVTKNKQSTIGRKKVSSKEAFNELSDKPVIVDVNYDAKTIAVNLFTVNGVAFTRAIFSYSGGDFEADKFRYTSLSKSGTKDQPKVMVVLHQPNLSKLEMQAVRIPKEMSGMHFGRVMGEVMCTPAALVATITVGITVALVGTAAGNCLPHYEDMGQEVINPQIKFGQTISVKELVALRQKAIQETRRSR